MRIALGIFSLIFTFNVNAQDISLEQFASGFQSPVDISHAGDERLFVVERAGVVKIVLPDGLTLDEPFLDIDDIVFNASFQSERGLLGIAFHPNYAENGFFYVNYTDNNSNTNIARYSRSLDDPNLADASTRELIMEIEQPATNHNGGCIKFGPDGYLYIGMGDGGSGDDPWNNSQNTQELLGKMLRIDVDNGLPYTVPKDNPFVNDPDVLDEIWSIGLRNPWRFSFDRETGDMWIGDVGQNQVEEVDFETAGDPGGHNYGWRCYEGTDFTNNDSQSDCDQEYTDPIYEVQHMGFSGPCSLTGGYVYRGSIYTDLYGKYFCADYCSGEFFAVEPDSNGGWTGSKIAQFSNAVTTFGEDINGELYITSFGNGTILKLKGQVTGTSETLNEIHTLEISPNPFIESFEVIIESETALDVDISILDASGRLVYKNKIRVDGRVNKLINLTDQPFGIYILNLNTKKGLITRKIIKA